MANSMIVQETILKQIRSIDKWALGAWGARELKGSNETLYFRVNGTKLKAGWIEITLDRGTDTYTVKGLYQYNMEIKTRKEFTDVYCENLVQVIDSIVG